MKKCYSYMLLLVKVLVISGLLIACSVSETKTNIKTVESGEKTQETVSVQSSYKSNSSPEIYENNINSILWYQKSGEARALFYQAYNLADMMLEKAFSDKTFTKKPAVIVDLDETILDNSSYMATLAFNEIEDWSYWDEWSEAVEAKATPGSVEFLNKAVKRGADVFYVSNRYLENIQSTKQNLINLGFPQVNEGHMLFMDRNASSSKDPRRQKISETHDIVLLIGDNLGDFTNVFQVPEDEERNKIVDDLKDKFGKSFIVTPNPMYGYWIDHLQEDYDKMTPEQKRAERIKELNYWKTDIIKN